jgi:hypothetical protein
LSGAAGREAQSESNADDPGAISPAGSYVLVDKSVPHERLNRAPAAMDLELGSDPPCAIRSSRRRGPRTAGRFATTRQGPAAEATARAH